MTSDFIGGKITVIKSYDDGITKVLKNSPKNNLKTVTKEHNEKIPKKKIFPLKKDKKLLMN